jgi:Mn-dependent DtxR family transcriptional regulator
MWIAAGPIGLRIGIDGPEPRSLMYYLEEAGYLETDYEENVRLTEAGRHEVLKSDPL